MTDTSAHQTDAFDTSLLQISPEESDALLAEHHPCILSIGRKGKGPLAVPLWYEYRDGIFVLGMDLEGGKAKLLAKRGRATITVQRPEEPYLYVGAEGPIQFLGDEELAERGETVWSTFRPVVERYLEPGLVDRYIAMLPILAPNYRIMELTPESMRGESIPRHDDMLPSLEEIEAMLPTMTDGTTALNEQAAARLAQSRAAEETR
jgi:nitroimidazol reductase NimA-like FMN-containing flavoprotein (pyridoxamine 5'-phosphate oxidase superfamily)